MKYMILAAVLMPIGMGVVFAAEGEGGATAGSQQWLEQNKWVSQILWCTVESQTKVSMVEPFHGNGQG